MAMPLFIDFTSTLRPGRRAVVVDVADPSATFGTVRHAGEGGQGFLVRVVTASVAQAQTNGLKVEPGS